VRDGRQLVKDVGMEAEGIARICCHAMPSEDIAGREDLAFAIVCSV
jgi:hypothetical protein